MDRAAKSAIEAVNAAGGIGGRPVKYVAEDTASNPADGVRKFRSLVDRSEAQFVIGATQSGVNIATLPVAKEMQTPYFPQGMAEEKTGTLGNRYIFQVGSDTYIQAAASTETAFRELGKEWTFIFSDFSWGWSHFNEQSRILKSLGAKINEPIAVPLDARDLVPYVIRIPATTNVIYPIAFGSTAVSLFTQINSMKLNEKAKIYSVVCTHEAISPKDLGGASEGFQMLEYHPRQLPYKDTAYNRNFFSRLGIDARDAKEVGGSKIAAMSHAWAAWETVFFIKAAVEKAGWKTRADHPSFIQALEGLEVTESAEHPQGSKRMRAEDHKALGDQYMSRIENGEFSVVSKIPAADYIGKMPPKADFRLEKV